LLFACCFARDHDRTLLVDSHAAAGDAAAGDAALLPVRAHIRIVDQFDALKSAEKLKRDKAKAKRAAKASAGKYKAAPLLGALCVQGTSCRHGGE
jgi:hypothetical protein